MNVLVNGVAGLLIFVLSNPAWLIVFGVAMALDVLIILAYRQLSRREREFR